MSFGTMNLNESAGNVPKAPTFMERLVFAGDDAYVDGGTEGLEAAIATALGKSGINLVDVIPGDCGGTYIPRCVETPGEITDTTTYPVADQDTKTFIFSVDGEADETITVSGATTTNTAVAAELDALAGARSYVVGGQVYVKSERKGPSASIEFKGGTTDCLFATGANAGSNAKKLQMVKTADGADAKVGAGTADLSGTRVELTAIYQ